MQNVTVNVYWVGAHVFSNIAYAQPCMFVNLLVLSGSQAQIYIIALFVRMYFIWLPQFQCRRR